jgi:hypothetical protein
LADALGEIAPSSAGLPGLACAWGRRAAGANAPHFAHEMGCLAREPLVGGSKLGPELADGGRLLVDQGLRRTKARLQRDPAVLQSA